MDSDDDGDAEAGKPSSRSNGVTTKVTQEKVGKNPGKVQPSLINFSEYKLLFQAAASKKKNDEDYEGDDSEEDDESDFDEESSESREDSDFEDEIKKKPSSNFSNFPIIYHL